MKAPDECANMEDIRAEIDRIDQDVIALMGKRFKYVQVAAKFKTSRESVKALDRFTAMLRQRRHWAEEEGLSPDVIEKMYSDLVEYFINEEMAKWNTEKG